MKQIIQQVSETCDTTTDIGSVIVIVAFILGGAYVLGKLFS